jgi:hypothetical protein
MSATKGLFKKYPNPIFIETGSMGGDGIQQALDEGFELIYSIELLPEWFGHCAKRYEKYSNVHIFLGDSTIILERLLRIIDKPVTFWLDAHVGAESTPLLSELEIIKQHNIKTHTILIDDLRDWKMKFHGFNTEILKQRLLEINPDYIIKFEDGFKPNDILVARI